MTVKTAEKKAPANIAETIRKLLAMAEHEGSNANEANVALEKATALLHRYDLERSEIIMEGKAPESKVGMADIVEMTQFHWKAPLIAAIARPSLCHVVQSRSKHTFHVFGRKANVDAVTEMFKWIAPQLQAWWWQDWQGYRKDTPKEMRETWQAYQSGWFGAAISAIRERLQKPFDEFKQGNGRELVIFNDKAVGEAVHREFSKLGKSHYNINGFAGRAAGDIAGRNVSFTEAKRVAGGPLQLGAA